MDEASRDAVASGSRLRLLLVEDSPADAELEAAALGVEAALDELRANAGRLYDADAVAACERAFAAGFTFPD
jgi:hypothetical protein